jgi:hypothetical protein
MCKDDMGAKECNAAHWRNINKSLVRGHSELKDRDGIPFLLEGKK